MSKHIFLQLRLQPLEHFLKNVLEGVDAEMAVVHKREIAGEFVNPDDLSNAYSFPLERQEIAIRAVYYEINALVEWELVALASVPFHNSSRYRQSSSSIKLVWHLSFKEICSLVEQYYEIRLSSLPAYAEIQQIRDMANSFKHRAGHKDNRKERIARIPNKFEPSREDAYRMIEAAREFLTALLNKTEQ